MNPSERLANAILSGDALEARSVLQDVLRDAPDVSNWIRPQSSDAAVLAVAAAITELLAQRTSQPRPGWTESILPLPEPMFLVRSAGKMKRLRQLCEQESPAPLRKRNLFAPPNYLEFA